MTVEQSYARLLSTLRANADLAAALHLLEWDQETYMPAGVVEERSEQIGTLAALLHGRQTAPALLDLVDDLAGNLGALTAEQAVDVRETKWRLDRKRVLDAPLVRERAVLHAQARARWIAARRDDAFDMLAPSLARIVAMERRVATIIDAHRPPYEVLLEGYEPGASLHTLTPTLEVLRTALMPLVERLRRRLSTRPFDAGALCGTFPLEAQRRFNRAVAEWLGFDFSRGRLDEAAHPFTTAIGADVRLTTRYDEGDLRYGLFSTIHEAGHGLYEQGLEPAARSTPRGQACSLGIHESQSRLWENQIGRSPAFWEHLLPIARRAFPALDAQPMDAVLRAVNAAQPSLIRTEADEITYNLHIILRCELERALIDGSLAVDDLPAAWRARMETYLGVSPHTDREGVLQDVHWASGAIGYFPTYTLGNVYAAQLLRAAEAELGPLHDLLAGGECAGLLGWLRTRIHRWGQTHRAPALIANATGHAPTPQALIEHLERKVAFLESA